MEKQRIRLGELAREMNMSKSTLHNWKYGGTPGDLVALKRLADYFSISVDEICFGITEKAPPNFSARDLDAQDKEINIGSYEIILLKRQK